MVADEARTAEPGDLEAAPRQLAVAPVQAAGRGRVAIVRQTDRYEPPVQRTAEALVRAGFDVEVICMRTPERAKRTQINGVLITSLPTSLKRSSRVRYAIDYMLFFVLAACTLTARHLRRRYAVVQVNTMPDFLVFAAIGPKLLGAPVIAYFNEPMPELAETVFGRGRVTRALMWIEQLAIRFADHTFTVTEELKARFVERGASPDRISVILNGADPNIRLAGWQPRQPDTDKTGFVIVCHGAIEDRYGQDTIIEAARLLRPELPDLRVVFTGRGSFVPDMLQLIDRAGLGDVISFKGWVPRVELNDVLHSADVGIVAQKASPYSHLVHTNKMVDYWILGLPVIASRLDAVSALYGDDVLEFYEPDDAADLARAIRRLHGDEARRIELVRNGRAAQERNGWAAQEKIFLGVYEKLVRADG